MDPYSLSVEREASKNIEENERECFKDAIVSSRSLNKGYVEPTKIKNAIPEVTCTLSKNYALHVSFDVSLNTSDVLIKFGRKYMSWLIIKAVIQRDTNFGSRALDKNSPTKTIFFKIDEDEGSKITNSRLEMIKETAQNVLRSQGFVVQNEVSSKNYLLTCKSSCKTLDNRYVRYLCGVVCNADKKKESSLTIEDYILEVLEKVKEINQDRLSDVDAAKVAKACVTYEMLAIRPNVPVVVNKAEKLTKSIKEAAFILYNNARVNAILDKYNVAVKVNEYPEIVPLTEFSEFQHVTDDESWDLIYNYLMGYPDLLKTTVTTVMKNNQELLEFHLNHLWSFLSTLAHKFSSYYRTCRILMSNASVTEKSLSIMSERLHLLQALQVVFKNTLTLLNVEQVYNM